MFPIAAKLFSVILAISLSLGGCGSSSPQDTVSDALGVDCSAGEAVSAQDSHGGFHGDGVSYIQLAFPDDAFLNEIRGRAGWQPLPLDEPLTCSPWWKTAGTTLRTATARPPTLRILPRCWTATPSTSLWPFTIATPAPSISANLILKAGQPRRRSFCVRERSAYVTPVCAPLSEHIT